MGTHIRLSLGRRERLLSLAVGREVTDNTKADNTKDDAAGFDRAYSFLDGERNKKGFKFRSNSLLIKHY